MAFLYNWITAKQYKVCYYISVCCLVAANFCYATADSAQSLAFMIAGRIFLGAGGARIVTRKFVALMVAPHARTKYSAIFVAFTALGKTGGPGMSSVFQLVSDFEIGPWNWRYYNAFSYVAFVMWCTTGVCVFLFFQDIQKQIQKQLTKVMGKSRLFSCMGQLSRLNLPEVKKLNDMKKQINLVNSGAFQQSGINFKTSNINIAAISKIGDEYLGINKGQLNNDNSFKEEERDNAVDKKEYEFRKSLIKYQRGDPTNLKKDSSIGQKDIEKLTTNKSNIDNNPQSPMQVYFPNKITWFCFWCFLACKSVQESFFYETPQVMKEYFSWDSKDVGFAIAASAVFAIPIALMIAPLSKKFEDRQILFWSLWFYLAGILMKVNWLGSETPNLYLY
jgi:hypothetical protein